MNPKGASLFYLELNLLCIQGKLDFSTNLHNQSTILLFFKNKSPADTTKKCPIVFVIKVFTQPKTSHTVFIKKTYALRMAGELITLMSIVLAHQEETNATKFY